MLKRPLSLAHILLFLTAASAFSEKPLTNDDVVKLANLGIGEEAVIAKIEQASTVDFNLEVEDIVLLKKNNVTGPVIAAMLARSKPSSPLEPHEPAMTTDQIQADLLREQIVSSPTQTGFVEFTFSSLSDFLDIRIEATRERGAVREYDVALLLSPKAVSNLSALDALSMFSGSRQTTPDRRPYLLRATIVYTKSGNTWSIANVKPTYMERFSAVHLPGNSRPSEESRPPTSSANRTTTRTGLGYRIKTANVAVYKRSNKEQIKGYLPRGTYVANAKGNFLGIPMSYQPEEENGRTHIAVVGPTYVTGWVETSALETFSYSCRCEESENECSAIKFRTSGRTWTECMQEAITTDQTGLAARLSEHIRRLEAQVAKTPTPGMEIRGIINAKAWGAYDTYQGWYFASLNRRSLARSTLLAAKRMLEGGRLDAAGDFAALATRYYTDSNTLNDAATDVLTQSIVKSSEVLSSVYRASTEALRYGIAIEFGLGTPAYDIADFLITAADFAVDYGLEGVDAAKRDLAKQLTTKVMLEMSGLNLQVDGTQLLGQAGVYAKLSEVTHNPEFAAKVLEVLGRSTDEAISQLAEARFESVVAELKIFTEEASDPALPE